MLNYKCKHSYLFLEHIGVCVMRIIVYNVRDVEIENIKVLLELINSQERSPESGDREARWAGSAR